MVTITEQIRGAQALTRLFQLRRGEVECIECGSHGPHETNGEFVMIHLSISCIECGEHMEAQDILEREGLI